MYSNSIYPNYYNFNMKSVKKILMIYFTFLFYTKFSKSGI